MLALLMAVGNRRGDIVQANDEPQNRKSLANYNAQFLDSMLTALTGGTEPPADHDHPRAVVLWS
jgi:hypothetical protein